MGFYYHISMINTKMGSPWWNKSGLSLNNTVKVFTLVLCMQLGIPVVFLLCIMKDLALIASTREL